MKSEQIVIIFLSILVLIGVILVDYQYREKQKAIETQLLNNMTLGNYTLGYYMGIQATIQEINSKGYIPVINQSNGVNWYSLKQMCEVVK